MPPTTSLFLMPDAMIIIALHEMNIWESFCSSCRVLVPSIVAVESEFFHDADGWGLPIHLEDQVSREEASLLDMETLKSRFDQVLAERIHAGELEALTLFYNGSVTKDCLLCTSDRAVLYALVCLDLSNRAISLESALDKIGLRQTLEHQYTEDWFQDILREARIRRIQGTGLAF